MEVRNKMETETRYGVRDRGRSYCAVSCKHCETLHFILGVTAQLLETIAQEAQSGLEQQTLCSSKGDVRAQSTVGPAHLNLKELRASEWSPWPSGSAHTSS